MANRFWVGDGGDWNDTAHWATSSGGTGGASVPISTDNVTFDANSFPSSSQAVNIDAASACNNFTATATNSPVVSSSGAHTLGISGNWTLDGLMTFDGNTQVDLVGISGSATIQTNGSLILAMVTTSNGLTSTKTWTLQDNLTMVDDNNNGSTFVQENGIVDMANNRILVGGYTIFGGTL